MNPFTSAAALLGRIGLSAIFLLSGVNKITNWEGTVQYMQSKDLPMVPLLLAGAIVFELVGGLSVLVGYKGRLGAVLLILFLIPATVLFHNFWALEGEQQQLQMIMFLKNLAILGGLLLVVAHGSGPWSVDQCCCRSGGPAAPPGSAG